MTGQVKTSSTRRDFGLHISINDLRPTQLKIGIGVFNLGLSFNVISQCIPANV